MTEIEWWQVPETVGYPPRPWPAIDRLLANARLDRMLNQPPAD